ncbi:MAG: hypothetical protein ACRD1K_15155 [Acidimicrobiales bacterium]
MDLTPHEPDVQANLRGAFDPDWQARAIADLPDLDDDVVTSLIRALPGLIGRDMAVAVAERAFDTTNPDLHQLAAQWIAER